MKPRSRSGFSLTELLVSMTILMSLLGLSVAGLRPSSGGDSNIRLGAQQLVSALIASQSRSVKEIMRTAVTAVPDAYTGTGSGLSSMVYDADRHPPIEGTVVQLAPTADPTIYWVSMIPTNDGVEAIKNGYRIQFFRQQADGTAGPNSAWFAFSNTNLPAGQGRVRLRTEDGQTAASAVWPTMPTPDSGQTLAFRLARYPTSFEGGEALPKGVAIDLRFSGYGDPTLTDWGTLADKGAVAVGFNETGSVDALMQNVLPESNPLRTVQPFAPCEPIYFFVTSAGTPFDAAETSPLANPRALWVVLHPRGGRVTIAENVPQLNTDAAAIRAAREKARKGIPPGALDPSAGS